MISALSKVSPVKAVRGNTDDDKLPATLTYMAGAIRFVVYHGVKNEEAGLPDWKDDEAVLAKLEPAGGWRESGDIIVYGHSHVPRFVRHATGVTFLNPGKHRIQVVGQTGSGGGGEESPRPLPLPLPLCERGGGLAVAVGWWRQCEAAACH